MDNPCIKQLTGRAIPLRGDDIDTDRIIPARFLRCVSFDGLGEHAFEDDRQQNPDHAFDKACYQGASVLIAGRNFGCGSSREHAPQSLYRWGIRGIVAESFAEIFFGNCQAMGIPCFTVPRATLEKLWTRIEAEPALKVTLDVEKAEIRLGSAAVAATIPPGTQDALITGKWNATALLREAGAKIDATAAALTYLNDFR